MSERQRQKILTEMDEKKKNYFSSSFSVLTTEKEKRTENMRTKNDMKFVVDAEFHGPVESA